MNGDDERDHAEEAANRRETGAKILFEDLSSATPREDAALWLVWSNEHRMWWRGNHSGYTEAIEEAGRYTHRDAVEIVRQATLDGRLFATRRDPVTGDVYVQYSAVIVQAPPVHRPVSGVDGYIIGGRMVLADDTAAWPEGWVNIGATKEDGLADFRNATVNAMSEAVNDGLLAGFTTDDLGDGVSIDPDRYRSG